MLGLVDVVEISAIAGLGTAWLVERRRAQRMMIDPAYGIYTRVATEAKPPKTGSIIFWDIDDMRSLNQKWTYEGTDKKIRAVVRRLRKSRNCYLVARWYSGDEFIYNCPNQDAAGAATRIKALFESQGIGVTLGIAPIHQQDWREAVRVASGLVQAAKAARQHGGIYYANSPAALSVR